MKHSTHTRKHQSVGRALSSAIAIAMLAAVVAPLSAFATALPPATVPIAHAYPSFSPTAMEAFNLTGSAAVVGSAVRLTPASASQTGTMFTKQALHLRNKGAFSTAFSFKIDPADGGNGLSFVMTSDPSSLVPSGIGFTGGGKAMRVEFDTHQDSWDINDNHVTFWVQGDETYADPLLIYTPSFDLDDGAPKYVWIDYNGTVMYVQISDSPVRTGSSQLSCGMSAGYMPAWDATEGDVYFGFLSTTGTAVANHDILSWYLDNKYYNFPYFDPNTISYSTGPARLTASAGETSLARSATQDVTFVATDKSGMPFANQTLVLSTPLGGTIAPSATTDAMGVATVTFSAPDARQLCTVLGETTGGLRASVDLVIDDTAPSVTVGADITTIARGGTGVIAPAATVADAEDTTLTAARVRILDKEDGEWLSWLAPAFGIGASGSADGSFNLSGAATLANYEAALRNVTYSGSPASSTRYVEFSVFDGLAWSEPVIKTVQIGPMTSPAGADRYETAIQVSQDSFPGGSSWVVIATGENWPDALGGSALAGWYGAPILLSRHDALPEEVQAEIERLGASQAFVLGGEAALSADVYDGLTDMLGDENVTRLGGVDRFETANLIASRVIDEMDGETSGRAFVATGQTFADALSASPIAANGCMPIFLSGPDGLSDDTAQLMADAGVSDVVLLGGEAAVAPGTEVTILSKGMTAVRIDGANRYETAAKVAEWGVSELGMRWDGVALATGTNFPDALAGGPAQGYSGSVLLLTDPKTLSSAARTALEANAGEIRGIRFLGATAALSQAVRDAANDCLIK